MFRQGFTCPALLVASSVPRISFSRTGAITHYGATFQKLPLTQMLSLAGWSHFCSPLLWESRLISFPPAT